MGGANIQIDPAISPPTQHYHAFTMEDARKLLVTARGEEMATINIISLLSDLEPDSARDILQAALTAYTAANAQPAVSPLESAMQEIKRIDAKPDSALPRLKPRITIDRRTLERLAEEDD